MHKYRIYYADGSIYSGPYKNAPGFGVICILQEVGLNHIAICSNAPYYFTTGGEWMQCYENDLIDSLVHRLGEIKGFCVGQIVTKQQFTKIWNQAQDDKNKENLD